MMAKNISVYVKNKKFTPSSYYRVIQYMEKITGYNILIREAIPDCLYKDYINRNSGNTILKLIKNLFYFMYITVRFILYLIFDIIKKPENVIISKGLIPKIPVKIVIYLLDKLSKKTNLIWDFDDNILENDQITRKEFNILEKNSEKIIVTGEILKQLIKNNFREKVIVLPTTDGFLNVVNAKKTFFERKKLFENKIVLVWVATSGNLIHLESIFEELDQFASIKEKLTGKKVVLKIICDKPLVKESEFLEIKNIKWTRDIVEKEFASSHLGIMPLINNEFTKGKGGFKLIQYQLAGLPIVASDVGYNKNVYNGEVGRLVGHNGDWVTALNEVTSSEKEWEKYSYNSLKNAEQNFSFEKNLNQWKEILK